MKSPFDAFWPKTAGEGTVCALPGKTFQILPLMGSLPVRDRKRPPSDSKFGPRDVIDYPSGADRFGQLDEHAELVRYPAGGASYQLPPSVLLSSVNVAGGMKDTIALKHILGGIPPPYDRTSINAWRTWVLRAVRTRAATTDHDGVVDRGVPHLPRSTHSPGAASLPRRLRHRRRNLARGAQG